MRPHRMDLLSLIAGLSFAGIGIAAFAGQVGATVSQLRWVAAIVLTALGVGLVFSARSPRSQGAADPDESGESDRT